MPFSAVLDTCVLYPAYLRDTLLRLAAVGLYRPQWSHGILDELRDNLIEAGLPKEAVERMIATMTDAFDDAEVAGYESLMPAMTCDEKDRHVAAAAVRGDAGVVVTFNLRDFPPEALAPYDIDAVHPDDFLLDLLDLAPALVLRTIREQAARYVREPRTIHGLLNALTTAGVPRFADEVRRRL